MGRPALTTAPTREGTLHNLCAVPVFAGIPIAAMTAAISAARRGEYRWAGYSAGSAVAMTLASARFGAAFGGAPASPASAVYGSASRSRQDSRG